MSDINQLLSHDKELDQITRQRLELANQYRTARKQFAELNHECLKLLSKRLLQARYDQDKAQNYSTEKLEMLVIQEAVKREDDSVLETFSKRDVARAEYKGLDRVLKAHEGRQMSLQSIMKYTQGAEMADATIEKYRR